MDDNDRYFSFLSQFNFIIQLNKWDFLQNNYKIYYFIFLKIIFSFIVKINIKYHKFS